MKEAVIFEKVKNIEREIRELCDKRYCDGVSDGFDDGYNQGYFDAKGTKDDEIREQGRKDAWECARKLSHTRPQAEWNKLCELFGVAENRAYTIFEKCTASEAIAKIKEYEEKQKQEEIGCKTCAYSEHGEDGFFKCHAKGDCLNHEKWASKMTIDEAIAHGKEQLEVFGGEHRIFIETAIKALQQEPILDKIRAEIEHLHDWAFSREEILRIIDKYKVNKHEPKPNIKALGEDMRICQKSITDEKVLIGFNMAVAICNKHLAESEE